MLLYRKLPEPRPIEQYDIVIGRGVEPEVGALLYGLVRVTKPTICVETGLFVGDSASWIGRALADNRKGALTSCDVSPERVDVARERFKDLPTVTVVQSKGIDVIRNHERMDFVHVDSGAFDVRLEELLSLTEKNISPGGIVCYHDATRDMSAAYEHFAGSNSWPHIVFPSYVGFAVFQRPE